MYPKIDELLSAIFEAPGTISHAELHAQLSDKPKDTLVYYKYNNEYKAVSGLTAYTDFCLLELIDDPSAAITCEKIMETIEDDEEGFGTLDPFAADDEEVVTIVAVFTATNNGSIELGFRLIKSITYMAENNAVIIEG